MFRDYGTFIRRERVFSGMRQRDLAAGICSVDTISRIEKGSQTPTPVLFRLLVERLGVSGFSYGDFFETSTIRLLELQREIVVGLDRGDLREIPALLERYRKAVRRRGWEMQFFQFVRGWYFFLVDGNARQFLETCQEAMRVMRPEYRLGDDISGANLLQTEYRILNAAAVVMEREFGRKEGMILINQLIINQKNGKEFMSVHWRNLAVLYNNAAICERDNFPELALHHLCCAEQAVLKSGNALLTLRIARTRQVIFGQENADVGAFFDEAFLEELFEVVNRAFQIYADYWDFLQESCFLQIL